MIRLTPRQKAIVRFIPRCNCVADIGCDHGRLGAYLLLNGLTQKVLACDISEPSLQKAKDIAKELGLEAEMETRCGDGMKVLSDGEAQCVVIAGMGGNTIKKILECAPTRPDVVILQPMNATEVLKSAIVELEYHIEDDVIVRENNRFYSIFLLRKGRKDLKENEIYLPINSISRKDEDCKEYLQKKLDTYLSAAREASDNSMLNRKIHLLEEVLECFK